MSEYTERCAARDTRRAIEGVRKSMRKLQLCARHWGDLDFTWEAHLDDLPDLPDEVQSLLDDLDEEYPKRPRWRRTHREQ